MRARVLVGETRRRSTGATRSGLIGKLDAGLAFVRRPVTFAGLQLEQPLRIDGDGVALHGRRGGDGAGDDLALHLQALRARVDQPGAELREVENADHQRDQAGEIEKDDAAGEAGEALRDEELPDRAHDAANGTETAAHNARRVLGRRFGGGLLRGDLCGPVEHVVQSSRVLPPRVYRKIAGSAHSRAPVFAKASTGLAESAEAHCAKAEAGIQI